MKTKKPFGVRKVFCCNGQRERLFGNALSLVSNKNLPEKL